MSAMKPVTPDEAATVWRTIPNPSARRVAKALTQAGRRVHFATIARWRSQGWRPVANGPHPIEAARDSFEVAARLLTGDPALGAEIFVRASPTYMTGNELRDLMHRTAGYIDRILKGEKPGRAGRATADALQFGDQP